MGTSNFLKRDQVQSFLARKLAIDPGSLTESRTLESLRIDRLKAVDLALDLGRHYDLNSSNPPDNLTKVSHLIDYVMVNYKGLKQ